MATAGFDVEAAWQAVTAHKLAPLRRSLLEPFEAAVRLVRWMSLRSSAPTPADLGILARRYVEDLAWADVAINDAFRGVDDPHLSSALEKVVHAARLQRRGQEREFAESLREVTAGQGAASQDGVASPQGTVYFLERLLPKVVLPMARRTPVLLLVMDGMSVATATEVLTDATDELDWVEAALPGSSPSVRGAALAVLPSLTEVSRTSLLTGQLSKGHQHEESAGYETLTRQQGKVVAELFHKKAVDTTRAGWSVSEDVGAALDNRSVQLVTVVLNTIDDALDRSDPAGTTWTAEAVKHLEPLLDRARAAGRIVVMTADHGHVVERRSGIQRQYDDISSSRSRAVTGAVETGEIEISGDRVLTADHRAVLAVDEDLRYGPLKAGYHGGASAAEVVVPVAVLLPSERDNPLGLTLLPPQMPDWWLARETAAASAQSGDMGGSTAAVKPAISPGKKGRNTPTGPDLFDSLTESPVVSDSPRGSLGRQVVDSAVYRAQRNSLPRLAVTDRDVEALLDALLAANGHRLPSALAARALGVNERRLPGAIIQVSQLLNVEGYKVISTDAATGVIVLDRALLGEQMGIQL